MTHRGHIERTVGPMAQGVMQPRVQSPLYAVMSRALIPHEADVWGSLGVWRHPPGIPRSDGAPFKLTNSAPGLAWLVLTYSDESLQHCRLRTRLADSDQRRLYLGTRAIRWWAAEHLPLTLERARGLLARHPRAPEVQPCPLPPWRRTTGTCAELDDYLARVSP